MSKILETADGHSVRRTMSHDSGNGSLWLLRGEEDHFPRIAIHISTLRTDAINARMDVRDIGRPIMDLIVRSIKRYESQLPSIVEITDAIADESAFFIDGTTIDVYIANKRKFYLGFPPNAAIHFSTTWRKNNHAGMWSQRTFTAGIFPDDKIGVSDFTRHMKRLAKQPDFNGFRDATYVVRGVLVDDEIDVGTIFEENHVKYVADSITSITTPPSWLNEEETGRRLSVNARSAFYYRFGEEQNDYVGKINAVPGGLPFFLRFDTGDAVPSEGTIRDAVSFFAHHLRNGEIPYPQVLNGDGLADHNGIFKSIELWFSTRAELSSPLSSHARTLTHIRYIPDGLSATEADVWKFPSNEALFEAERRLLEQGFPNNYGESQDTSAYACFSWFGNDGPETFPEIHEFVGPENFLRTRSRHIPECMKEEFAADLAREQAPATPSDRNNDPEWIIGVIALDAISNAIRSGRIDTDTLDATLDLMIKEYFLGKEPVHTNGFKASFEEQEYPSVIMTLMITKDHYAINGGKPEDCIKLTAFFDIGGVIACDPHILYLTADFERGAVRRRRVAFLSWLGEVWKTYDSLVVSPAID